MFGWKKLVDGFHYATEMSKAGVSDEKCVDKVSEVITNFGRTNFIAGGAVTALGITTGITTGIIGSKLVKKFREKKNKKLEGSKK